MNFKSINEFDENLYNQLNNFCKKSKPLGFCSHSSPTIRNKKIKEYINFLENCELKFLLTSQTQEQSFIVLKNENNKINMIFIMNISTKNINVNSFMIKFNNFIFKEYPNCEYIYSDINRKFKLKKYLSWIERYMKSCKIKFDNDKIIAYWYKQDVK